MDELNLLVDFVKDKPENLGRRRIFEYANNVSHAVSAQYLHELMKRMYDDDRYRLKLCWVKARLLGGTYLGNDDKIKILCAVYQICDEKLLERLSLLIGCY